MTNEDVFVFAAVAVLALDVRLHRSGDLGDDNIRDIAGETLGTMRVEFLDRADRECLLDTGSARNRRKIDPTRCGMRRRPADRLVALVVPDHDEQVFRLLVAQCRQNAQIEHHAAVGIERYDATMRKTYREPKGFRRDAAELLLEKTGATHMRSGVVPLVDAGAKRQDHQFVLETSGQRLHAVEPLHRTTSPPSATAE